MKNRNLLFLRMVWIFGAFLTLLPFCVKAEETRSFLRYAAILTQRGYSEASARFLPKHYATTINAQDRNGWPVLIPKQVVLAVPPGSGKTQALTGMNNSERLVPSVPAVTSEALAQCKRSLHSFAAADAIVPIHSVSDGASPIHFQLEDSLIYVQASLNGSQPLWMMLDTGSSVTVFDESASKNLGIRFPGKGNAYGPGQGSAQKLAFASHATLRLAGANLGNQTVATLPLA